jgi:hypothetical protein
MRLECNEDEGGFHSLWTSNFKTKSYPKAPCQPRGIDSRGDDGIAAGESELRNSALKELPSEDLHRGISASARSPAASSSRPLPCLGAPLQSRELSPQLGSHSHNSEDSAWGDHSSWANCFYVTSPSSCFSKLRALHG